MKVELREVECGFGVSWIEMDCALERSGGTGEIVRTLLGDTQEEARTALARLQLDDFAQRSNGGGGIAVFSEEDAEVEIGFRHFWIEGDSALVFGAGFGDALECRVAIGELEVRVGDVGFFGEELLERWDGGFEIVFIDVALGFVEEVI
jgi:hypothetical protein